MELLPALGKGAVLLGTGLLLLGGLAGSVIPGLPGPPLIFLGAFFYALLSGFEPVGGGTLVALGILAALAQVLDYLASALGARRFGGTAWGVWGSILGGLAGLLLGTLPGMIAGIFAGAFLLEFAFGSRDAFASLRVGWGSLLGFLGGTLMKVVFSLVMIGIFLFVLLQG